LTPDVVPKENVADVTFVSTVIPLPEIVKLTDWLRNGLCALFPAIEPLALL
jgi:hypothetical protein